MRGKCNEGEKDERKRRHERAQDESNMHKSPRSEERHKPKSV